MTAPKDPADPKRKTIRRLRIGAVATAIIATAVVANGIAIRKQASAEQTSFAATQSIPTVTVVRPQSGSAANVLTLPGNLQAWYSAPIYARVPGYLTKWYEDIGAHVHKGDPLADIDTPELDQQIAQAKADLANTQAARQLSQTTNDRWQNLLKIGAVAKQDADNKTGDLAVKTAAEVSSKANLDRLVATKTFAHITAPFDGVVTQRTTDVGALINQGGTTGASLLFTVADLHKIRVYVHVPQNDSALIRGDLTAELTLPEYPGQKFPAHLVSTSNAIDGQTNTLLVELDADNASGKLKPGEYAQVSFELPVPESTVTVPASALLFRGDGLRVATINPQNQVVLKAVTVAEDLGTSVRLNSGVSPTDRVIDNPPDSIGNGDVVRVATTDPAVPPPNELPKHTLQY
ncbi:MAG TPA: efflux RND transporter periplasmic adaptor subunit [Micropepsaceae bacterium]|nr:efflux RND transporter periplasmic adaptor subunit [Micropepsaceae bacterium]